MIPEKHTSAFRDLRQGQAGGGAVKGRGKPLLGLQRPGAGMLAAETQLAKRTMRPISAWFGSYGTALERAAAIAQSAETRDVHPGLAQFSSLIEETVIGMDERVEVVDTQQVPYSWICALTITAADGSEWLGTGWCAAPGLVITAGHCVYLHNCGGWATAIRVDPARNGSALPYSFECATVASVSGWVNDKSPECDYGGMIIPSMADSRLGWLGYGSRPDDYLLRDTVNVVGYPADKPSGTMWGAVHALSAPTADELIYVNSTFGGMSGSPVIEWSDEGFIVLGIHNYGDLSGNRATRITTDVFGNLQMWAATRLLT
jgi:glutamyl endopeptidase